ncbi:MAG: hypothetical protein JETCAE02_28070 [Anaerolineaceae bacterium]|nr:MAG: hypothetical protein JETCAE02_28070 [Anaerolineaceae bacterium]
MEESAGGGIRLHRPAVGAGVRLISAGRFGGETVHEWGNEYSNGDGARSGIRGLNSWMVGVHNFNDTLRGDVQSP